MPIVRGLPPSSSSLPSNDDSDEESIKIRNETFGCIVRSKGFSWLAHSHVAAMYWSHAGSSFELECLGRWWATLTRDQWPEEAEKDILVDFDCSDHDDELVSDLSSVGDRRQEIVFIGPGVGDVKKQTVLKKNLDSCLLTDDEFDLYKELYNDEEKLSERFANPVEVQMSTY